MGTAERHGLFLVAGWNCIWVRRRTIHLEQHAWVMTLNLVKAFHVHVLSPGCTTIANCILFFRAFFFFLSTFDFFLETGGDVVRPFFLSIFLCAFNVNFLGFFTNASIESNDCLLAGAILVGCDCGFDGGCGYGCGCCACSCLLLLMMLRSVWLVDWQVTFEWWLFPSDQTPSWHEQLECIIHFINYGFIFLVVWAHL